MAKQIVIGPEAREKVVRGITKLADAVTSTLGPNGRNVLYSDGYTTYSTKDGVTVAKNIELSDPFEQLGVSLIKQAAVKTADYVGDGTTTSTLLASEIVKAGMKHLANGVNAVELKREIDQAVENIIDYLESDFSVDIESEEQLEDIATISANGDNKLGKLIATAIQKVGREGAVVIEESNLYEDSLEIVEGIQFDRGYKSHYFVTNNSNMTSVLENPYILIADKKFTQVKELLPILEGVSNTNRPLLIIADDIEGEALATLIVNKMRGTLKVAAVKAPDFGDRKKLIMDDIAILTGGEVYSTDKGMKLDKFSWDWFGEARTVTITKEQTTIVDGKGRDESIQTRIEELQQQIEKAKTPFETEKLQERLAKFTGGIGVVNIGGATETEIKEKKDRAEDALFATRAAVESGIVPGGGCALLKASNHANWENIGLGADIVREVCRMPATKILRNAGASDFEIFGILNEVAADDENWTGYDLVVGHIDLIDLHQQGILDPTKVTVSALRNAASIAGTILLTETVIVDEPKDEDEQEPFPMG